MKLLVVDNVEESEIKELLCTAIEEIEDGELEDGRIHEMMIEISQAHKC